MPSPKKRIPDRTMFQPMRFVNMPSGKQNGFAIFHITQSEAYERYEFSKRIEKDILQDFFLETCNPSDNNYSGGYYPDEYPDNYTYLQLIPVPKERAAKTKPKSLPVELIELLKSYISTQPDRSKPSDMQAFGKRKSDRSDRSWNTTVINRALREKATGIQLRKEKELWIFESNQTNDTGGITNAKK